jgi:hypothetical protein
MREARGLEPGQSRAYAPCGPWLTQTRHAAPLASVRWLWPPSAGWSSRREGPAAGRVPRTEAGARRLAIGASCNSGSRRPVMEPSYRVAIRSRSNPYMGIAVPLRTMCDENPLSAKASQKTPDLKLPG